MVNQRITLRTLMTIGAIETHERLHGFELIQQFGWYSGTTYPFLQLLEQHGLIQRETEDVDPSVIGRPVRVYYTLTEKGARFAKQYKTRELYAYIQSIPPLGLLSEFT